MQDRGRPFNDGVEFLMEVRDNNFHNGKQDERTNRKSD